MNRSGGVSKANRYRRSSKRRKITLEKGGKKKDGVGRGGVMIEKRARHWECVCVSVCV